MQAIPPNWLWYWFLETPIDKDCEKGKKQLDELYLA